MNLFGKLFPRKIDSHLLYTEALESIVSGDTETAFLKLRELVKGDTDNVSAYVKLGDILREKEKAPQAVKIHQSLTFRRNLRSEQKIEIYSSLAKDYYSMGQFVRAEENANRVMRLDKKNEWASDFLVKICERQKRWKEASMYLKKLERILGEQKIRNHAYYKMMEGRVKEEQSGVDDARDLYLKATKLDDSFSDPYLYLGNLYEREKNLEKAVECWMKFAEKSPRSGKQIYSRLEKALFELGRFGEIEDFYRSLMSSDPKNIDAVSGLVNVLQAKGDLDQALSLIDEVLARNAHSIRARLARLKLSLRKIREDQLSAEVDKIVDLIQDGTATSIRAS